MRHLLIPALLAAEIACAQMPDPDRQPYWSRYTFVEDSSVLVPLSGAYKVYYIQRGQWWSMPLNSPHFTMKAEDELRMRPLFDAPFPAFTATPARDKDAPDVKVVVVRGLDTMVVELSVYFTPDPAYERPVIRAGERRPPVVIPFRKGRFLPTGSRCDKDYYADEEGKSTIDARTVDLTKQFDALWKKAMQKEAVIPQLNTDTCHQVVAIPDNLDMRADSHRDVWLVRSPYCGTHFVHFPLRGAKTVYSITFVPYLPDQRKEPITLAADALDDVNYWLDISDWPVGDHPVQLTGDGISCNFTFKLR